MTEFSRRRIRKLQNDGVWVSVCAILLLIINVQSLKVYQTMDEDSTAEKNTTSLRQTRAKFIEYASSIANNVGFNMADLQVKHKVNGLDVNIEAFKVGDQKRSNQWISIGQPTVLKNKDCSDHKLDQDNIILRLELLPEDQKISLIDAVKKRNPKIREVSIDLLPLQSVTCKTTFFSNGDLFELQGSALHPTTNQVAIKVPCPMGSEKRRLFEARIKRKVPLEWNCKFIADAEEEAINHIDIAPRVLEEVAADHNLFGTNEEIYITRKQMSLFSQKIRDRLQIEEEYDLDESFVERLVERMISIGGLRFQFIPIGPVLTMLSTLGLSMIGRAFEPDEIKRKLSDELNALMGSLTPIIVDKEDDEDDTKTDLNPGGGISIGALFSIKLNTEGKKNKRRMWYLADMSKEDQLKEINKDSRMHTKFELEGNDFVPKLVKVAVLRRKFLNTYITVPYGKIVHRGAKYKKEIPIITGSVVNKTSKYVKNRHHIDEKTRRGSETSPIPPIDLRGPRSTVNPEIRSKLKVLGTDAATTTVKSRDSTDRNLDAAPGSNASQIETESSTSVLNPNVESERLETTTVESRDVAHQNHGATPISSFLPIEIENSTSELDPDVEPEDMETTTVEPRDVADKNHGATPILNFLPIGIETPSTINVTGVMGTDQLNRSHIAQEPKEAVENHNCWSMYETFSLYLNAVFDRLYNVW